MGDEERRTSSEGRRGDPVEGGFSILIGEESIRAFMSSGDFSSARELDRFIELGARIEGRFTEEGSRSILAMSVGENRLSRDFSVLQIAHILAKHGKDVLIVDCDFLSPGLSGLVENTEDHGFLDLLLYGSSLKTVARSTGIDGVIVVGPGSFPVSRTISPVTHVALVAVNSESTKLAGASLGVARGLYKSTVPMRMMKTKLATRRCAGLNRVCASFRCVSTA